MGVAHRIATMPVDDYLAAERDADVRHEYVNGELFAMAGASRAHNRVVAALAREIGNAILGGPCRVAIADMKVRARPGTRFYYPDLVVSCNDADDEPDPYYETSPSLIVEVLSPSTEQTDRREKRLAYATIKTLGDYLLVDPDRHVVERYSRDGDGWSRAVYVASEMLSLPSIGAEIDVERLFM